MKLQAWMTPEDLAPGDKKCVHADMSRIEIHRIVSGDDPHFDMAFGALWDEFGHSGELERAEVLSRRLRRESPNMRYEMILLKSEGKFAAACDHTVIVDEGKSRGAGVPSAISEIMGKMPMPINQKPAGALVHISHNLIAPAWRRTGLGGWLRAISVTSARTFLASIGCQDALITIVGEVEYIDHSHAGNIGRLHAYEKAGYKKIDPAKVKYLQPDFRPSDQIDHDGRPSPVPLCLVIRRVGNEAVDFITGTEMLEIVGSLYRMFALDFRPQDMECLYESLKDYPAHDEKIALIPPTAA